ncbi:MAG: ATPase [Myxococcaceae bacterium]|nr:ATPase [Myxococcaceae bacterium]MEA2753192.1 two-component system, NtrC family, response regulator HydG [Myxococcales bacterium]
MEKTLKDALRAVSEPPEAGPTVGFVVEVVSGPDQGKRLTVANTRMLVGTSPICDLVLTDERVSRRHVALSIVDNTLRVEDLDSTNGTVANEMRIAGAYLRGGETVTIGKTLLLVTLAPAQAGEKIARAVSFGRVLGTSPKMQRVYQFARKIAASDISCTIEGETGTGKEQLAEAIHDESPRTKGPFIVFDCTALPGTLMESALFGHEKGSFTGASATRRGVFEQADGGTLFIDEIGDLDIALQPKLLRAIQRGETQRVGGTGWMKSNVRILAATRRDLDREVQEGRFRDDLFFRLAVARIELPPLRERGGDVELLARAFWASLGPSAGPFPPEFLARYRGHTWPGNVRELLNTVVRWQALGEMGLGAQINEDAPESLRAPPSVASVGPSGGDDLIERLIRDAVPFSKARQLAALDFERRYVTRILESFAGNVTKAAQASGIGRRYFHMLLAKIEETEKP